ncbi:MAG: hypothetical protein GY854_00085 [Deltaproteobacteria bacterium]|nr:hypothetical protein [Deltaproteobacteria bacterium]
MANYSEQVAFYPNGDALAVWNRFGASNSYDIWGSKYVPGGVWEEPWVVNTTLNGSSEPQVVINDMSTVTSAWNQSQSIHARVFH